MRRLRAVAGCFSAKASYEVNQGGAACEKGHGRRQRAPPPSCAVLRSLVLERPRQVFVALLASSLPPSHPSRRSSFHPSDSLARQLHSSAGGFARPRLALAQPLPSNLSLPFLPLSWPNPLSSRRLPQRGEIRIQGEHRSHCFERFIRRARRHLGAPAFGSRRSELDLALAASSS